jgi:hypothetical protein
MPLQYAGPPSVSTVQSRQPSQSQSLTAAHCTWYLAMVIASRPADACSSQTNPRQFVTVLSVPDRYEFAALPFCASAHGITRVTGQSLKREITFCEGRYDVKKDHRCDRHAMATPTMYAGTSKLDLNESSMCGGGNLTT